MKEDPFFKALSYAQRFLAIKDRSQREVEGHLREKGYGKDSITKVIEHLCHKRLIDDGRFAREWIKASSTYRPKGIVAIKDELVKKGVNEILINDALKDDDVGYDERKVAKALADKRLESIRDASGIKRRKSLYSYLARRGFSFDIINDIIDDT
jgi:regulatory protein